MHVQLGSRRLAYQVAGHGQPLVLLHAFPFDGRFWDGTVERLRDHATVIVPDLRGFGQSDRGAVAFSVADLADDVAELLDALGQQSVTLVGVSWGGYIALAFAQKFPARLTALILADTKAGPDSAEARDARADAIALVASDGVTAYVEKQLPRLLGPAAGLAVRETVRTLGRQQPESIMAGLAALRDRPDRRAELPAISCPTLIMVGADDVLTPPAEARAMATAIPNATLVEIPGCGHLPNLEAPDAFCAAVVPFLAPGPRPCPRAAR